MDTLKKNSDSILIIEKQRKETQAQVIKYKNALIKSEYILKEITNASKHPRIKSMVPCGSLMYLNGVTITSEYQVKLNDYQAIYSLEQTINYIEKVLESLNKSVGLFDDEMNQLTERISVLAIKKEGAANITQTQKGYIVNDGEFLEIIEEEPNVPAIVGPKKRIAHVKKSD